MIQFALLMAASVAGPADSATSVHYRLKVEPAAETVAVRLQVTGLAADRDSVTCRMPRGFAFVNLPEPLLAGEVVAGGLEIERLAPYSWRVETAGATELSLEYRVPLTHRRLDAIRVENAEYEFPYVTEDHGLLVSGTLLMQIDEYELRDRRVEFECPEGWKVLAPWPAHGAGGFAPPDDRALVNDLIAVGSWKERRVEVEGYTAILAAAPGQEALLDQVADSLAEIIRGELEIFDVLPNGRYLFLFSRPDSPGFGGSTKSNSMTLNVTPEQLAVAEEHLLHLVAHEFFHTWAASRASLPGELRWVNEGITDYFAYITPLQLGIYDLPQWHASFAEKLGAFEMNALRGSQSLVEAGGPAFFENTSSHDLTYAGGLVIGAWLDAALQQRTDDDLVDLMRHFTNDERWDDLSAKPTSDDFFAALQDIGGKELAERVRALVSEPFELDLTELFAEVDVELTRELVTPTPSPRANFDEFTITGIDPSGQAGQAGLRSGDRLIEVNGVTLQSTGDIYRAWGTPIDGHVHVRFDRAGEVSTISYALRDEVRYRVRRDAWGESG